MGAYDAVLVNTYLYGVVSHQYFEYYGSKFEDPARIRWSVLSLLVIDTIYTILMIYLCWAYLIANFGNNHVFEDRPLWPIGLIPAGTAFTACITHAFVGARIFGVTKSRPLLVLILTLTLAELAAALAMSIRIWTITYAAGLLSMRVYVVPWLAIQTTLDILVSGFLSFFLHRNRTGNINTDNVINRLIRGAIRTGAFSTILATTGLVVFFAYPKTLLYSMFMIPIGRTYTTTLMNTLNVRTELKQQLLNSHGDDGSQLPTKANDIRVRLPDDVQLRNLQSAPPPSPNIPTFYPTRSTRSCSTFSSQEVEPASRRRHSVAKIFVSSRLTNSQVAGEDQSI